MPASIRISPDGRELPGLVGDVLGGPARAVRLLGLSGSPGAGKSTLAPVLAAVLARGSGSGSGSVVVPMDGFHLADVELDRRGLRSVKGAPETFDAQGYAALLARVRGREALVMAPAFDRDLDQPLAGAIAVPADSALVVTEGNYLLLPDPPWPEVRAQLDEVWHVHVDDALRCTRLVARHVRHGRSEAQARSWVEAVDEPNARRVEAAAHRADLVLDLTDWVVPA